MRAITNDHLKAAADAVQKLLGSRDRMWCEEIAKNALSAAHEVDKERGRRLAREAINRADSR